MHEPTLVELGLLDSMNLMIYGVGWRGLMTGYWDTYSGLVLDFLSSADLVKVQPTEENTTAKDLTFRLGNVKMRVSVNAFNDYFGLPRNRHWEEAFQFIVKEFWCSITLEDNFVMKTAKSTSIKNLIFQYMHRVLSNSIFERWESDGAVRATEFYILWCLATGYNVNIGFYLAKYLVKVASASRGQIMIGGLITPIAISLGINVSNMRKATGPK